MDSPNEGDVFWHWLREGWKYRIKRNERMRHHSAEYAARVKHECGVITNKEGYISYFLFLSDIVRKAKDKGIPVGPGRGSASASLVCYLLRITEVDPLQFPSMMFERFLDPGRLDMPDVDLDISDIRRADVRDMVAEKYGENNVGNIGNFIRYKGKNSINDVARVYRIPLKETQAINNLIIERSGGDSRVSDSLQDTFDMFPQAKAVMDRHPELNNAIRLEGNYRGMSVHAAGLVVSSNPITDICAMYEREVNGHKVEVLAYDKKDAEHLGMLKADFLGLSTMGMIEIILDMIDMPLDDLYQIPLDDSKTLNGFYENDLTGIFQFEGRATRLVNRDVVPNNFMELADITSLSRPGPLFSGMTAAYTRIKHGKEEPESLHPIVDEVTAWTKGQIIYQEQVLTVIRELGGFPVKAVGDIRRIISQKLGEAQFNSMLQDFIDGAKNLPDRYPQYDSVNKDMANRIWKFMVTSATYSFNTAHAVSYAMISYYCMYLKQHYPLAFYAAQLRKIDKEKWPKLLRDAENHGISIKPPSVTRSGTTWTALPRRKQTPDSDVGELYDYSGGTVRAGFEQVPGIATKTATRIVEARDAAREAGQAWRDWIDLASVKGIGPKTVSRIEDFCQQEDPFDLHKAHRILEHYRQWVSNNGLSKPSHKADEIPEKGEHMVLWLGIVKKKQYKDLIEDERARTGDSFEDIIARTRNPDLIKSCVLHCYDDTEEEVYLRFNRWEFLEYKDIIEKIEEGSDLVLARGLKREGFGTSLQVKGLMAISDDEDGDD